ncbi:citrate lyase acyl carrier protein [Wukongibacter baidiensis]|uniref:citrate lyase acyl carrier protein n=1 Tax=Wukongibacter baidiensis TaxID=1723361 RepID=UPI003D7F5438
MKINKAARAGTMESNDIYVMVYPNENGGIMINLESVVIKQFGNQIRRVIEETLEILEVKDVHIVAKDRGALDYTIKARVETAIKRAI